jgi:hypothetical protein
VAYVAITEKLIASVNHNIDRMCRVEHDSDKLPQLEHMFLSEQDWLRKAVWGPLFGTEFEGHPGLNLNADKWSARFVIVDMRGPGKPENRDLAATECPVFGNWPRYALVTKEGRSAAGYYGSGAVTIYVRREQHPYFDEWCKWYERSHEITARWGAIKTQIEAYLRECKSLNQAVKLWPDITRYLDSEYRQRLEMEVVKTKPDPTSALQKLQSMDMEQITASTVLARLISADQK